MDDKEIEELCNLKHDEMEKRLLDYADKKHSEVFLEKFKCTVDEWSEMSDNQKMFHVLFQMCQVDVEIQPVTHDQIIAELKKDEESS